MKQTKKYTGACEILTYPHNTQEELYRELNRLGFYWHPDKKKWERDDTPAKEATRLIKIRVWASTNTVQQAAELIVEQLEGTGLRLIEQSEMYQCRPPLQNESRIYLVLEDESDRNGNTNISTEVSMRNH